MWPKGKKQKKLRLLLLAVILIMFGIITARFIGYRGENNKGETDLPLSPDDASVAIGKVHQTASRDGKTEWRMDAGSVKFVEDQQKAFFDDISITFFLENGEEVYLSANEGVLKTDTNDIEVNGNVVVRNTEYRMVTDTMYYQHNERIVTTQVPVKITGDYFSLEADSMEIDLNKKHGMFKGNIKGNIDETAKF